MKPDISQTYLKSILDYNALTGEFTWLTKHARNNVGDKVKVVYNQYVRIGINGISYSAHRLAFIYMTGSAPTLVDHKNKIRSDNVWTNLRSANVSLNNMNTNHCRSSTGIRGISFNKASNKFEVRVKPPIGKIIFKSFNNLDDAIKFNEVERSKLLDDQ
jgi:hypothetical protein